MPRKSIVEAARARQREKAGSSSTSAVVGDAHLDFVGQRYDPPLLGVIRSGELEGQTCSVLERGNTTGMSATWLVNTIGGIPMILRFNDVQLTGLTCGFIPPPPTQLQGILENITLEG